MSDLPIPKWLHLSRWETYAFLALASIAFLNVVAWRCSRSGVAAAAPAGAESVPVVTPQPFTARPRGSEPQWLARHKSIVEKAARNRYDVMLLGDSITQGWDYNSSIWRSYFPGVRALNAGIASDRIEHVLWRVDHGLFDKARPRVVVLLVGINNLAMNSPGDIAGGVGQIVRAIERRSPSSRILLLSVFPSGREATNPRRARIQKVNAGLATLAMPGQVEVLDIGSHLVETDGTLTRATSFDAVHLTNQGYDRWATAMQRKLLQLLGP